MNVRSLGFIMLGIGVVQGVLFLVPLLFESSLTRGEQLEAQMYGFSSLFCLVVAASLLFATRKKPPFKIGR